MSRLAIRRLRVDGFGRFRDLDIGPLDERITVFRGPNEAGKSTLLEFIRTILFGFPRQRADLWYPPLQGGRHGGLIELAGDAEAVTAVTRHEGKGRGPVEVIAPDGQLREEEYLADLLGAQGEDLFANLYAFTLDELQSDALLRDENVNRQIYSAGVGERNLPKTLADLDQQRKAIYSPRGRLHRLFQLRRQLQEIDEQLELSRGQARRYGQIKAELGRSEGKAQALRAAADATAERIEHVRRLQAAWDDFTELQGIARRIGELPQTGPLPDAAIDHLNALEERVRIGRSERDRAQRELADARARIPAEMDPRVLADSRQMLEPVVRGRSAFAGSVTDLPQRQREYAEHLATLAGALAELGPDWTAERVAGFDFSAEDLSALARLAERVGRAAPRHSSDPDPRRGRRARLAVAALASLLGISGAAALLWAQPAYIEPSAAANVALVGVVLIAAAGLRYLLLRRRGEGRRAHESELAHSQWRDFLKAKQLDLTLTPERVGELRTTLERARAAVANCHTWQRRIDAIKRDIAEYTDLAGTLANTFGIATERSSPEAVAEVADALISLHAQMPLWDSAVKAAESELAHRSQVLESDLKQRSRLFAELGADDSEQLRQRQRQLRQRRELGEAKIQADRRLQRWVQVGCSLGHLQGQLTATDQGQLAAAAAAARTRKAEIESELEANALFQGGLSNQLAELAAESESDRLVQERSVLMTRLAAAEREWVVLTLAGELLAEARRRYETERQPGIIRTAQSVFAQLSDDRYPKILAPLGSDEIAVVDRTGVRKEPRQLSRGTREQLYLALRFGLIAELGRRMRALPVAVDEILVNFDPERARRAAQALLQLAQTNQLLVFTCHPQTLEFFDRAAGELAMPAAAVIDLPAGTRWR